MGIPLHLFKAGRHTDRYGRTYDFSVDAVKEMAFAYNPALYRAPLQIDHEGRLVDGYLQEAAAVGEHLFGVGTEVSPQFAAAAKGRQVSLQLFTPDAPDNPTPGAWGIAHVALVSEGAIKLLPPEFSRDDPQKPVFCMKVAPQFAAGTLTADQLLEFLRLLKDLLAQGGMPAPELEEILPEEELEKAAGGEKEAQEKIAESLAEKMPGFSKPLSPLEREVRDLKQQLRRREIEEEADRLVFSAGKLPPRLRKDLVEFLAALDRLAPVQFSGGRSLPPYQFALNLFSQLPPLLRAEEIAATARPVLDDGRSGMAEQIRQYQREQAAKGRHLSFTQAREELLKGGC